MLIAHALFGLLLCVVSYQAHQSKEWKEIELGTNLEIVPSEPESVNVAAVTNESIPIRPKRVRNGSARKNQRGKRAQRSRVATAIYFPVLRATTPTPMVRRSLAKPAEWRREIVDAPCCNESYVYDPPKCIGTKDDGSEYYATGQCSAPRPPDNRPCKDFCYWSYDVEYEECSATCGSGQRRPKPACITTTSTPGHPVLAQPGCCYDHEIDGSKIRHGTKECEDLPPCPYIPPIVPPPSSTCQPCTSYPCPQICTQAPCPSPCCSGNCHHGYNPYSNMGCVQPPCYQQPCNFMPCQPVQPCGQQPCGQQQCVQQPCQSMAPQPAPCRIQRHPGSCVGECNEGRRKVVLSCVCEGIYSDLSRCGRTSSEEFEPCPLSPCTAAPAIVHTPVTCHWQWSSWSACVARQCGPGHRTRTRECVTSDHRHSSCDTCGPLDFEEEVDQKGCPITPCCEWVIHYGDCSAACGNGHKIAHVSCESTDQLLGRGKRVDESCCDHLPQPTAQRLHCNEKCCDVKWHAHNELSQCNCHDNKRTRQVDCMCDGTIVDEQVCRILGEKPKTSVECGPSDCCQWKVEERWSSCSRTCGEGIQSRGARCYNRHTKEDCDSDDDCGDAPPPSTTKKCNLQECCNWSVSNVKKCDCHNSKMLNRVECKCGTRPVPDSICFAQPGNHVKPPTEESCPPDPHCYKWNVTTHTNSQTCLPLGGFVNVHVTYDCITKAYPVMVVSESHCRTLPKPATVDKMWLEKCPPKPCPVWKLGLWGACVPSSDGRYQQRRSVHCVDDHTLNPLSDRDCTSRNNPKPEEHRACMRIRIRRHKGSYRRLRQKKVKRA